MASQLNLIRQYHQALLSPSTTNKREIMEYLLTEYDRDSAFSWGDRDDKEAIIRIFNDRRVYEGLSSNDIKSIDRIAEQESGFLDTFGGLVGHGGFDTIRSAIRDHGRSAAQRDREEGQYSQQRIAREGIDRAEADQRDIDYFREKTEFDYRDEARDITDEKIGIEQGFIDQLKDRYDVFDERQEQFEDLRSDRHRRAEDELESIEANLGKRRELSNQILAEAKKFGKSPSIAEAEFKQRLAQQERLRTQEMVMQRGGGFKGQVGRADIAREIAGADKFQKKLHEDQVKQQHTQKAMEDQYRREAGMDVEIANAKRNVSSEKNMADAAFMRNTLGLDENRRHTENLIKAAQLGIPQAREMLLEKEQVLDNRIIDLNKYARGIDDTKIDISAKLRKIEDLDHTEIDALYNELSAYEQYQKNLLKAGVETGIGVGTTGLGIATNNPALAKAGLSQTFKGGSNLLNYKQNTPFALDEGIVEQASKYIDGFTGSSGEESASKNIFSQIDADVVKDQLKNIPGFSSGFGEIGIA